MFLDDIKRKLNKQRKGWEKWDDFRYIDLKGYQTIVDFIGDIKLLCVRNLGTVDVNVEIKGMQTRIAKGEEKYFNDLAGRQVILHVKEEGGRVFVGQSYRGDITAKAFLFLVAALLLAGCVGVDTASSYRSDTYTAPSLPVITPEPKTPHI
jgi:hypothetical protein